MKKPIKLINAQNQLESLCEEWQKLSEKKNEVAEQQKSVTAEIEQLLTNNPELLEGQATIRVNDAVRTGFVTETSYLLTPDADVHALLTNYSTAFKVSPVVGKLNTLMEMPSTKEVLARFGVKQEVSEKFKITKA